MGIGGTLTDHHGTLLKAFTKNVGVGLFNETKILAVMEGLKLAKVKGLSNLLVEGDFAIVICWVNNKERSS